MSTLLHGLLVLGAVWFWTLRPPELRPMFQGGDISLAVTFVVAADGGQTTDDGQRTTDPPSPERFRGQATDTAAEPPPEEGEDQDMLDAEAAAPVSAQASANAPEDGLPTDLSAVALAKGEAPGAKAGRQAPLRETATAGQATDLATEPPSDALRQGVSGAVRMQSEIRPYYPLGARLRGEEGAVTVRVWVKPSGRVSRSEVIRSSGFPALDEAAVDAAQRAHYVSTRPGAWRAEVATTLTFRFRLTE